MFPHSFFSFLHVVQQIIGNPLRRIARHNASRHAAQCSAGQCANRSGFGSDGKEVFAAATINYKEEVLFTINYRTDITTAHVVRYNGILYDITRVDTFEGYKEDLTLYCSRRARQYCKTAGVLYACRYFIRLLDWTILISACYLSADFQLCCA